MGKARVAGIRKCETKRGRPKGHPKPLSQEERRLRNTILERQRRDEMAEAFQQLQNSVMGQDKDNTDRSRGEIISEALNFLAKRRRPNDEPIENIMRQNYLLQKQIEILERKCIQKRVAIPVPESSEDYTESEDE